MSADQVRRLVVVGSGIMGQGIAYVAALAGIDVTLVDVDAERVANGIAKIAQSLDGGVARGKVTPEARTAAAARLHANTSVAEAVRDADVVIEAVPEQLALKQSLFQAIDGAAPAHAVLASNTSSLSIGAIAASVADPSRVVGMHFFNPVHAMKLVEVVRGAATSDATANAAVALAGRLGKTPIVVRDTPGFATSRLGVVLGLEAMRMLEQGVASAEDIDRAMELGYNHPVGPLKLTDLVGLDIRLAVADHLHATLGDETYAAPAILRELVAAGKLGKKSGEGFYRWDR